MTALSLALSLLPDLDGLDDLIEEYELFMQAWLGSVALLAAFLIAHAIVDRFKSRSPVEKLLRKRQAR